MMLRDKPLTEVTSPIALNKSKELASRVKGFGKNICEELRPIISHTIEKVEEKIIIPLRSNLKAWQSGITTLGSARQAIGKGGKAVDVNKLPTKDVAPPLTPPSGAPA